MINLYRVSRETKLFLKNFDAWNLKIIFHSPAHQTMTKKKNQPLSGILSHTGHLKELTFCICLISQEPRNRHLKRFCHTQLHLGFSAKLRIWQVPTCKMEPRSGIIIMLVMISPCSSYYKPLLLLL